jgi:hypothetical protein
MNRFRGMTALLALLAAAGGPAAGGPPDPGCDTKPAPPYTGDASKRERGRARWPNQRQRRKAARRRGGR